MLLSHIVLGVGWIVFCLLHSLLASLFVKEWVKKWMGHSFRFYRLYYTLFAFTGFAMIVIYQVSMPSPLLFTPVAFTKVAGALVSFAGLLGIFICIRKYFIQLSGLRSLVLKRTYNKLMITGIHQYVRHPLYAATFVFTWGLSLFLPNYSLLITNIIITIYTLTGIGFEENKLLKEFGEPYKKYMQTVPKIIPRLIKKRPGKTKGF